MKLFCVKIGNLVVSFHLFVRLFVWVDVQVVGALFQATTLALRQQELEGGVEVSTRLYDADDVRFLR